MPVVGAVQLKEWQMYPVVDGDDIDKRVLEEPTFTGVHGGIGVVAIKL